MRTKCMALALALAVSASAEQPRYGGELNIGTVYVTLSALSWDPVDWTWKSNHDVGLVREQLFAGDLTKGVRNGGAYTFVAEAYLPTEVMRGELAESWEWEDPLTLAVRLRKGVRFPAKPGIMEERDLVADDVLYTFNLVNNSPKKAQSDYWDYIDEVEVRDDYTVVFHFNQFNAEWAYRFGYGYQSSITARELEGGDATDWRNLLGTGPFELTRYIHGNSHVYTRRDDYWDFEEHGGERFQLPYVDAVKYRIIKDEATYLTALRTGKLDILESVRWIAVDHLKETTPELKWSRWLTMSGNFLALRLDHEPFKDKRVRRALNLAVNQQEIVDLFYGGHAELMAYPQHPGFGAYYQPLEEMPESVQELFTFRPGEGQAASGRSGLRRRFHVQSAGLQLLPEQHGSASPARVVPRRHKRQDRDPADGVRLVSLGDDHQDPWTGLFHEQRAYQSDDDAAQVHPWPYLESSVLQRPGFQRGHKETHGHAGGSRSDRVRPRADGEASRFRAIHLATHGVRLHRLVAVGQELRRRAACGCGAAGAYLQPYLDRSGAQRGARILTALLEINDLSVSFRTDRGTVRAVDSVNLTVNAGETLAIVGESGSGKSVTALSILQLIGDNGSIDAGEIKFEGTDLLGLDIAGIRDIRGDRIAMIFQEPMSSLNPVLTIGKQVAEPIWLHRRKSWEEAYDLAGELLAKVAIPDAANRLDDYPHHFSGGMRQRVMIAMALACEPKLIIADEPTTALDVTVQAQILALLKELTELSSSALILITHDLGVVARYADRVAVMYAGRIVETASARALYGTPRHPYTEGLMASIPGIDGVAGSRLTTIDGQPPDLARLPAGCAFAARCQFAREECRLAPPPLEAVGEAHWRACYGYTS